MHPADINTDEKTLTSKQWGSGGRVHWHALQSATLCRLPSLLDETGLVLEADSGRVFVRETQPGYEALFAALALEAQLPGDWYPRVEGGEQFVIALG